MPTAITERALTQRINRALAKQDRKLMKARGRGADAARGDFWVVDVSRNMVVDNVRCGALEAYGKELSVMHATEELG